MSIRRRLRDEISADYAAAADPVLNDHGLGEIDSKLVGDNSCRRVDCAARLERDLELNGAFRIGLRMCRWPA